ncbi:MAG: hypothetical protein Q8905_15585 [Bacteroidota bacterium]|nr:hypothetical protein [Bacteroidota bacterium]
MAYFTPEIVVYFTPEKVAGLVRNSQSSDTKICVYMKNFRYIAVLKLLTVRLKMQTETTN